MIIEIIFDTITLWIGEKKKSDLYRSYFEKKIIKLLELYGHEIKSWMGFHETLLLGSFGSTWFERGTSFIIQHCHHRLLIIINTIIIIIIVSHCCWGHLGQSSMRRGLPTCVMSPIGWNTVKCNPIVMMYCNVIVCNIICNIICLPLVESVTLYARVSIHCAPIQFTAIICAMLQCCGHCGFVQYDLYYRMCNRKTMLGSASCPQAAHWGSCPG